MLYKNNNYPIKLEKIGIKLLEPYKGSNYHHNMKCLICFNIWSATPKSKIQNHKKYGQNGCPKCNHYRIIIKNNLEAERIKKEIEEKGFTILEEYKENKYNILIKNNNCGHTWKVRPNNILARNVICKICNDKRKSERMDTLNKQRHKEYLKTATEWQAYKSAVFKLSRLSYKNNKITINPTNLPQGKAGTPGAYHIDHIVPIRYCYNNKIPPEICSHPTNLQMLEWTANIGSRDKLKSFVPSIFETYIKS